MKKVGERKNITLKEKDYLKLNAYVGKLEEFVYKNAFIECEVTHLLAINAKLIFNNVSSDIKELYLCTYFFGTDGTNLSEFSSLRYLDPNDNYIIFKKVNPYPPGMHINGIGLCCLNADINIDVDLFDLNKLEDEEPIFLDIK